MFRESGLSRKERGRYAGILRPYFDPLHQAYPQYTLSPEQVTMTLDGDATNWVWNDESAISPGDWTYSSIAVETNPDTPDTTTETDTFSLHIVGDSVNNLIGSSGVDQNWSSVGMIQAFTADRSAPTAEPADRVDFRSNPLALLKGRSESSYDVLAIADTEAADGPPYESTQGLWPVLGGYLETTAAGQQITRAYGVRVPAGLALVVAEGACEFRCVVRRIEMA
ncbi:MAG TPA: hypothetical protein EYN66_16905 [Myxococcales bacterium]|nr:hypothetical protein [Myxococcales bacterium]